MKKWILCFFIGFLELTLSFSQRPIWIPVTTNQVQDLTEIYTDSLGFIWSMAPDGLYKFDGYNLQKKLGPKISGQSFKSIDFSGEFYFSIGTSQGNLILYNPYEDAIISNIEIDSSLAITQLIYPGKEESVFLHYGHGINWKRNDLDTFLNVANILVSNEVYEAITFDKKLFLATDQGLQILSFNKPEIKSQIIGMQEGLEDIIVTNITAHQQAIWLSNFNNQVCKINLDPLTIETFDFDTKSNINDILFIKNQLVVCRDDGLYYLADKKWIKKYPENNTAAIVKSATIDEQANIWLSTEKNGLIKGSSLFQKIDLPFENIQAIAENDNGFFIGTDNGLFLYQEEKSKLLLDKNITCLQYFNDLIWVGTFSSGFYILSRSGKILKQADGWENHSGQSILNLMPTADRIFISSLTGVFCYHYTLANNDINLSDSYSLNELLGPGYIYQILEKNGLLYFATDQQGLKTLDLEKRYVTHISKFSDTTSIGSIYSMTFDQKDNLWIASTEGNLAYFEEGSFIKKEGINARDIYTSLVRLFDGSFLMVRSASVDLLTPDLNNLLEFNQELGIATELPFLNSYTIKGKDVSFTHDNNVFLYTHQSALKIYPEVLIDKVSVNLSAIQLQRIFNQEENNFQFDYTGAWLSDPNKLSYQYILEGFDADWRITKDRTVSYPRLASGQYTFKIRASQHQGFSKEPVTSFSFQIKKYFYNTWLLKIICAILLFLAFQSWRQSRRKMISQKEALEKQQIETQLLNLQSQLNPHFLFNSFNTLIGLIEEQPEKGVLFTERLTDFYRSILEFGKNDLIPLKDEVQLLETYIAILKERFDKQLIFNVNIDRNDGALIPPLTLQLLVENAVKHNVASTKKPLVIDIIQNDNTISVSNTLNPKIQSVKESGIGLTNISKRYRLNNLKKPIIKNGPEKFVVMVTLKT